LEATREDGSVQRLRAVGLQPLEDLQFPMVFNLDAIQYGQTVIDDLNALSHNAWGLVTNETTAAAFQLAAWEIAHEIGEYKIDDGHFQVTGDTSASNRAEETADGWLQSISTGVWVPRSADWKRHWTWRHVANGPHARKMNFPAALSSATVLPWNAHYTRETARRFRR